MVTKPKTSTESAVATKKKNSSGGKVVKAKIDATKNVVAEKVAVSQKKRSPRKKPTTHEIHPVVRHQLIEVAAYYVSEKRGSYGGSTHDDWLQAEQEIDAMIATGKFAA